MIIFDTSVVSEPTKAGASPTLLHWLDLQVAETLYLTSISLAELLLGVAILPEGKRKRDLALALQSLIERLFSQRILSFDNRAAVEYAGRVSKASLVGSTVSIADGQIAAIAAVHGYTVATRDTAPFRAMGVPVINPWR